MEKPLGYQVKNAQNETFNGTEPFEVFSLEQALKMQKKDAGKWHLVPIYQGDVERPFFMFNAEFDKMTPGFCCPRCGHGVIEQVMQGCSASSIVRFSSSKSPEYNFAPVVEGGHHDRYQCHTCALVLTNAAGEKLKNPQEFYQWIEHQKNAKKTKSG